MKITIFSFFLLISYIYTKQNKNQIINGHFLEDLEEDDLYIGQTEAEVMNLLGKPFKIPGQEYTLYYLKSERKIYEIFPLRGKNKKGSIIIIELDGNKKVKSIIKKEYVEYKHTNEVKEKQIELKKQIQLIENKLKKINKQNEEKQKKRRQEKKRK